MTKRICWHLIQNYNTRKVNTNLYTACGWRSFYRPSVLCDRAFVCHVDDAAACCPSHLTPCGLLLPWWAVCLSVCICVCLLVTSMSCAKPAGPIKMPFRVWTYKELCIGRQDHSSAYHTSHYHPTKLCNSFKLAQTLGVCISTYTKNI